MAAKNPTICIIEDNPEDREVFQRYLLQDTDYQYRFFEADTGERGLELCRTIQPDCVLLDYNLPDIDGLEFLTELADEPGSVPYAVIMLAGLEDEAIALTAMKRGAQDYLVKDEMTAGNLFRAIHNAIERTSMRRTLEQQRRDLERKNQELQAFAYALAHDLRAPLRAITGFSEIIAQEHRRGLDAEGQHYIDSVLHAALQMDRLINDLLNYTRIEHRTVTGKAVALEPLIQQIVASLPEAPGVVSIAPDLPIVYGDPTLFHQIFVNLIENALVYHRPDVPVQITVDWHEEGSGVVVCVRDNGIGIAPKHYERIFTIFQRLHSEEVYPGTGIGLAIVRKAAELMGSQVRVESVVGQGSTFSLRCERQLF